MGSPRVLVVGDIMLDVFMYLSSLGVKEERGFDVPNYAMENIEVGLGGAGLVALAARAAGAVVDLAGVVGDDEAGTTIEELCQESFGGSDLLVVSEDKLSTSKTRLVCDGKILLRMNEEEFCDEASVSSLLDRVMSGGISYDGVIVVDYGKGVCGQLNGSDIVYALSRECRSSDIPCMVSSKIVHSLIGTEATFVVCNDVEISEFIGSRDDCNNIFDAANRFVCDHLIVTNGRKGVSHYQRLSRRMNHLDGVEVGMIHSGIGAGDCLSASLMVKYLETGDVLKSLEFANRYAAKSCSSGSLKPFVPNIEEMEKAHQ
jgi:D-beta-D-heptose 7-phosphate kinase/D-beta-D-heptose 1-phosphate adenosyltransferase